MKLFRLLKTILGAAQVHGTAMAVTGAIVVGTTVTVGTSVLVHQQAAKSAPAAVETVEEDSDWQEIPADGKSGEDVHPVANVALSEEEAVVTADDQDGTGWEKVTSTWNVTTSGKKSSSEQTRTDTGVAAPEVETLPAGTTLPVTTTVKQEKKISYDAENNISSFESYYDEGDGGSEDVGPDETVNAAPVQHIEEKPAETIIDYMEMKNGEKSDDGTKSSIATPEPTKVSTEAKTVTRTEATVESTATKESNKSSGIELPLDFK